ncbi:MAG: hypothetical protein AAF564_00575 [Bacteroidota bacterium]
MLSLERCAEILNSNGENYTDDEIKQARDFLYQLASIDYEIFKSQTEETERSDLHSRVDRRTGRKGV